MGSWSNGCGRTFESESPEEPPAAVYETEEEEFQEPYEEEEEAEWEEPDAGRTSKKYRQAKTAGKERRRRGIFK